MLEWWNAVLQKWLTGLCLFYCSQPSCVVSQQNWFGLCLFHKLSNFTPPPPSPTNTHLLRHIQNIHLLHYLHPSKCPLHSHFDSFSGICVPCDAGTAATTTLSISVMECPSCPGNSISAYNNTGCTAVGVTNNKYVVHRKIIWKITH